MISVQKAIFPGIAAGCLFLVLFTSLIASPHAAFASNPATTTSGAAAFVDSPTPIAELPEVGQEAPAAENQPQASQEEVAPQEVAGEQEASAPAEEEVACSVSTSFPESVRQWCGWIQRYAGEHNLDPNLIASVMLQESGGNPDAYSKSGAVGLMQVMPRDGLAAGFMCINGPCFGARPSMAELYDPEFNIAYGTRMLAGLIQKNGSVRDALRAYGPMNMGYRYADIVLNILERYR